MFIKRTIRNKENMIAEKIQLIILLYFISFSLDCLFAYKLDYMIHSKVLVGSVVASVNLLTIAALFHTLAEMKKGSMLANNSVLKYIRYNLTQNKYIYIIMLSFFIIATVSYDTLPLYDSAEYFSELTHSIDKININPFSAIDAFSIIGKQMQFFSIIVVPFLILFHCNPIGIYFLNTILVIVSMFATNYILKKIFIELDDIIIALLSFAFGMFPFIYTGITYINPDFYCAVFLPMMVYCYLREYKVFFLYVATVFCGMKANMIITYGVLFFILILLSFLPQKRIEKKMILELLVLAIPILINIYLKFLRKVQGWSQQSTRNLQPLLEETKARLSQEYIYGFKWLILIFILIVLIFRKNKNKKYHGIIIAIPISSIVQLIVYVSLHNTKLSICPRYWAIDALMYIIGLGFVLDNIISKKIRVMLAAIFTCLISIQQFYTIDPAMHIMCKKIEFEKSSVFIMVPNDYVETIGIGDSSAYNMQYAVWNSIWREFLKDNVISKDITIYSTLDSEHDDIAYKIRYGVNGLDVIDWYYDSNNKTIVYKPGENIYQLSIENIRDINDIDNLIAIGDDEVIIFKPDTVAFEADSVLESLGYYVYDDRHYENYYTSLDVVVLRRGGYAQ